MCIRSIRIIWNYSHDIHYYILLFSYVFFQLIRGVWESFQEDHNQLQGLAHSNRMICKENTRYISNALLSWWILIPEERDENILLMILSLSWWILQCNEWFMMACKLVLIFTFRWWWIPSIEEEYLLWNWYYILSW